MDYAHQRGPYHHHHPSPAAGEVIITASSMTTPPPRYVNLETSGSLRPPPSGRRSVPRYNTHAPHRGSRPCLRCMCCLYCFLFLLLLLLSALGLYFVLAYNPRAPSYTVDDFSVKVFNPKMSDLTLYAQFAVKVRAQNPNDHIGFIYHEGSSVTVMYKDTPLCSGGFPGFYQGYQNVTIMDVLLEGTSPVGSGLQEALAENRRFGKIPLLVVVVVPASAVVGGMTTGEVTVRVNCTLVVSSISPLEKIKILSTSYDGFRVDIA